MLAFKQWVLSALAVVGAFFVAGIGGSIATDLLGFWHLPGAGFFAALAVVVTTYVAAPARKLLFSCTAFAVGAVLAWILLESSSYPETKRYGGLAYQPTHLPVLATYLGWHHRRGDCYRQQHALPAQLQVLNARVGYAHAGRSGPTSRVVKCRFDIRQGAANGFVGCGN